MNNPVSPPINGVLETCLYVDDLPRAVTFYQEMLGLKPMTGNPNRFQSFDVGPGSVLLLFLRGATLDAIATSTGDILPHDGHGPMHFALAIGKGDLGAWRSRFNALGVNIVSEVGWESGGHSLYFHDPDGNLGELASPGIWPNY